MKGCVLWFSKQVIIFIHNTFGGLVTDLQLFKMFSKKIKMLPNKFYIFQVILFLDNV